MIQLEIGRLCGEDILKTHTITIFFPGNAGEEGQKLIQMFEAKNKGPNTNNWRILGIHKFGQISVHELRKGENTSKEPGQLQEEVLLNPRMLQQPVKQSRALTSMEEQVQSDENGQVDIRESCCSDYFRGWPDY